MVIGGSAYCHVVSQGTCVTDGTGSHGNHESCEIRSTRALYATATAFSTESYFDYVTIGGTRYSGTNGPVNVPMAAGAALSWFADGSITCIGLRRLKPL